MKNKRITSGMTLSISIHKCKICKEPVESIAPVEVLPHNGVLVKVVHKDKTIHSWESYSSVESALQPRKIKPVYIECPKCGQSGRINAFRNYTGTKNSLVNYVITHEKIDGVWGASKKISKRRRCYMALGVQRDAVLKKLGRLP